MQDAWNKALRNTGIIRSRVQALRTFHDTHVPYVFLAESTINIGDTVIRKGEVVVKKPALILPPNIPQFEGFDFNEDYVGQENDFLNFLLVRGVAMPSLKYDNHTHSLNIFEGKLSEAIKYYQDLLQQHENVNTGLVTGPEDCWQFSILIFIYSQVVKNVPNDMKRILDEYRKKDEK